MEQRGKWDKVLKGVSFSPDSFFHSFVCLVLYSIV